MMGNFSLLGSRFTGALAEVRSYNQADAARVLHGGPLADVAAGWSAMWDVSAGRQGAAGFETQAADALAAWTGKRFELPDYYLVVAPAHVTGQSPDLYLGPLRSVRPRRVAVTGVADTPAAQAAWLLDTLRSLEHGPWWPPLDELIDTARRFYPGTLAQAQPASPTPGQPA